jgi:ABC-2 type transport system ATP-binding protein
MIATVQAGVRSPAIATAALASFEKVGKTYTLGWLPRHRVRAVDGVSFDIRAGEVFGLLGPNRAGKTTLVKILLSLCRADSGTITRLGRPITDKRTLARVGYMHENHAFPRYLTASALLEYYGAMSLTPYETVQARIAPLLEQVGLSDRSREPIACFSKGMVQRLGLAQALINDPELLVLDEPTEGLDLTGRQLLRGVIAEQRRRNRAVLLVSHVLTEVEQLCDRVAVIVGGRLSYVGPLGELTRHPATGEARSLEHVLQEIYKLT